MKPILLAIILLQIAVQPVMAMNASDGAKYIPLEEVTRDSYCRRDNGVYIGVVTAGTKVEVLQQNESEALIYSRRHGEKCWITSLAFADPTYIHPEDLARTLKWRVLVQRWLPYFPNLSEELVLSIIYKETKGNPYAVDQTGNDVRLVGAASVGLMGAIPRPHLPCYRELTPSDGRRGADNYACGIYLGMYILNSAIEQAYEIRNGRLEFPPAWTGTLTQDTPCFAKIGGSAVGWLRDGESIAAWKGANNDAGELAYVRIHSERHGRDCWLSVANAELTEAEPAESEAMEITREDIELGIQLFGCTKENVLANNCLSWGGKTYSDLVLGVIMPEISNAIERN